jgi:hypothetical protein
MMQLRRWTRIFFGAGVLCLGAGKIAAQSSAQGQGSLDEARKDLEELPSTATTPNDATKSLDTGKLDLVLPSNGGSANLPSTTQNSENAPSQGWLLDALNKDNNASSLNGAFSKDSGSGKNARQEKVDTATSAETAKAWTPLLQTWLLPQNRGLIPTLFGSNASTGVQNDGTSVTTASAISDTAANGNFAIRSNRSAVPAEWLTGDATYHDPLAQRPNPYLENSSASTASSSDFHLPRLIAPVSMSPSLALRSTDSADGDENLYPTTGDSKATARREEMPAPTAPVVNQQKYFPQLDRF